MSQYDGQSDGSAAAPATPRPRRFVGRLTRLTLKELREILRDRRTIITLVLMPLLVYPLLGVVFQKFVLTLPGRNAKYVIGYGDRRAHFMLASFFSQAEQQLHELRKEGEWPLPPQDQSQMELLTDFIKHGDPPLEQLVGEGAFDVGVRTRPLLDSASGGPPGQPRFEIELVYQRESPSSMAVLQHMQARILAWQNYREQLRMLRQYLPYLPAVGGSGLIGLAREESLREPLQLRFVNVPNQSRDVYGISLATVIPLILILMTITGAVYPAIDLTAGERERGTLEALVAAPLPRMALLFGKYVAVVAVALLTAVVNLVAMTITIKTVGLGQALFGQSGLSLQSILLVLALLVMFAVFFSAVLLAVTSFARSFKEAQAYLIPLMLLSLTPGVMSLLPGTRLEGTLAVVPLINMVLLARDVFAGEAQWGYGMVAVVSTALYAAATLAIAARIFGTDAILYGSSGTWGELLRRPRKETASPTVPMAMLSLALIFPLYFAAQGTVAGGGLNSVTRLALSAILTALLFGGMPLLVAVLRRVRLRSAFGWRRSPLLAYLGATILGLTLWPVAHEVYLLGKKLGLTSFDLAYLQQFNDHVRELALAPSWLFLAAMAFSPGIFEELCFRGFTFEALRTRLSGWGTIVVSALLFGVFHVISSTLATERLLPSTLMGLILGWVAWRAGSVKPGILLHVCHNGFLMCFALYQLGRFGRIAIVERVLRSLGLRSHTVLEEVEHLPTPLLLIGIIGPLIGFLIVYLATARRGENQSAPQEEPMTG